MNNWVKDFDQAIERMLTPTPILQLVDYSSLVVGNIDTHDYPDFCDAYFESGYYLDGTELPDDVLELLTSDAELLYEHITRAIY
jgi:hypothetical protein